MRMIVASSGNAASPARTESTRCAPPGTKPSRSPRSLTSQSGGRSTYPGGRVTMTCRTSGCPMKARSARNSIGTPRMGRNCFGSPGPARTPAPAATMTTATSGRESPREVTDTLHADYVETRQAHARARRQEGAPESLPRGFAQAPLHRRDRSDLAAQPHLSEEDCIGWQGPVVHARDERGQDGEIGRRLDEPDPAGHVHEHVERAERHAPAPLEYGEQDRQPPLIQARGHALWRA